jgi:primary-amine oxidase
MFFWSVFCVKLVSFKINICSTLLPFSILFFVHTDPWSSGSFGFDYEVDRHLCYAFMWVRSKDLDNLYAHPVDGLNAVVDIKAMKVVHVDEWGSPPIPMIDSNYDREFLDEKSFRTDLKPINVSQPEGVSFSIKGRTLKWHDWSILIGFTGREGITLHNITYGGRPVCYRASIAEMVVPYGSPRAPHYRKNVFDIGYVSRNGALTTASIVKDESSSIQFLFLFSFAFFTLSLAFLLKQ